MFPLIIPNFMPAYLPGPYWTSPYKSIPTSQTPTFVLLGTHGQVGHAMLFPGMSFSEPLGRHDCIDVGSTFRYKVIAWYSELTILLPSHCCLSNRGSVLVLSFFFFFFFSGRFCCLSCNGMCPRQCLCISVFLDVSEPNLVWALLQLLHFERPVRL